MEITDVDEPLNRHSEVHALCSRVQPTSFHPSNIFISQNVKCIFIDPLMQIA